MATAQNGWPIAARAQMDKAPLLRDITVPNGVLAGDVAVVFRWLARQYDVRVEQLRPGACWGWEVKKIKGSDEYSCHSAGCAVDFNADQHEMGDPPAKSMSQRQIDQCHAIERESGGVLRWGGDFSRPDPMHWEIVGTPAQVAAFANKIEMEDDMASVWLEQIITNPAWKSDVQKTPKITPAVALYQALDYAHSAAVLAGRADATGTKLAAAVDKLSASVDAIRARLDAASS